MGPGPIEGGPDSEIEKGSSGRRCNPADAFGGKTAKKPTLGNGARFAESLGAAKGPVPIPMARNETVFSLES